LHKKEQREWLLHNGFGFVVNRLGCPIVSRDGMRERLGGPVSRDHDVMPAGIEAARKRGQHLGRPKKLNSTQLKHARKLIKEGTSRNEVARILDINPSTLYRNLQPA